jgi:hypothetical protein
MPLPHKPTGHGHFRPLPLLFHLFCRQIVSHRINDALHAVYTCWRSARCRGPRGNHAQRLAQRLDLRERELVGGHQLPDPARQLYVRRGETYVWGWERMGHAELAARQHRGRLAAHAHLTLHIFPTGIWSPGGIKM